MDLLDKLRQNNCDIDAAVKRLHGRTDMYLTLVQGFNADNSLEEYIAAFSKGDYETAYRHMHNIKGLSSTFGFTELYKLANTICGAIKDTDYKYASLLNDELSLQHRKITAILNENLH